MAATHVMTSPSLAVAPHTPLSSSALSTAPAASSSSKKQEHLIAGRRRLEEFKQKKRGEKSKATPTNKENVKQATGQVLSGSHADGLPSGEETIGDSPSTFEGANGSNLEDSNRHDSSYAGKTFLDNKGATASPVLPNEKLHAHPWDGLFSQKVTDTKTSSDASPYVDFQGLNNLVTTGTASESPFLLAAQRHEKQCDDGKDSRAGGSVSSHEKKSGHQDPHIVTVSQTENAQITSANKFVFSKILHNDSEAVMSQQGVLSSRFTNDPFSNHSGPFHYENFDSSLKAPLSWTPSLSEAAPNVLHTDLSSKLESSRNSQDGNAIGSSPAFQIPSQVSTVTASHTPFSSVTDSIFSQQRLKITDTPSRLVKTESKVDRGREDNSSQINSVDIAHLIQANHSYVGNKFPTSGSFEKLRPSPDRLDEFASLEQHIEDLTQEKFSLQRGLDAARTLAESLAQENSALTEDFNQQGALINELKSEVERQESELHAQALIVNNLRMEREKAQQESNLAVERSQALAAEVVNLEERVLKVRSQELKLEKELKMLMSENASQRSQISSMEKDRTNLRSLIEALQEEKKVLQARLRKAASTVVEDARKSSKEIADASSQAGIRVDVSTSTDDLGMQEPPFTQEQRAIIDLASSSASMLAPEPTALIGSTSHAPNNLLVPNPWSSIPSEQSRKIENINVLITELAEEKAALVKTLKAESVAAVDLRALNAELSRKLESQTQQLELAVAQRMAHEGNFVSRNIYEASAAEPEFVDEGDEVVERVLGWIMKLFPGGSSRRGGSKQL